MEPMSLTTLMNVVILVLMIGIPVLVIALGVSLGLRLQRGENPNDIRRVYAKSGRLLLIAIALVIVFLWLFLSFVLPARQGQTPMVYLPVLLVVLAQIGFWVIVIAGAVWLAMWLARRMGAVGPARESPLDILEARYARGEISTEQFEEMKRRLEHA